MRIAVPKEIKTLEGRIAIIPDAVADLVQQGHEVFIEHDAGVLSGYCDEDFKQAGAQIVPDAKALYDAGEMIVKVKEPQPEELLLLRSDQILFSYLHLAAEVELMKGLQQIGLTAVAFETVQLPDGQLPLLAPMSDIAGRVSIQVGTHLLHSPQGGRGILLGGLPAAERGKVVILGAGGAAAAIAYACLEMGSYVTILNRTVDKSQVLAERFAGFGNRDHLLLQIPADQQLSR